MCGVFGLIVQGADDVPQSLLQRSRKALGHLVHRGPDGWGEHICGNTYIAHRRLAILDLSSAGRQPMIDPASGCAIAVNGEIYNYRAARQAIGREHFQSESDSEVVLHGYTQLGLTKTLDLIDGMYAGCIADPANNRVVLFRDRVGIKPLYLAKLNVEGRSLRLWASELKAIRSFCGELEIETTAILDFAAQRCIPAPKTIFKNVQKLLPGTYIEISTLTGAAKEHSYWSLPVTDGTGNPKDYAKQIRDAVGASVAEQLVADVPVGLFLSGGIDSAIIGTEAARRAPGLASFTVGFDDKAHDESAYAAAMAELLGLPHHAVVLEPDTRLALSERMQHWYDEPFGDLSALPTARLCELARAHCTVALSGDGGDELFGGYRWYHRYQRYRRWNRLFSSINSIDLPYRRPPANLVEKLLNRVALYCQFEPLQLYAAINANYLSSELSDVRRWLEVPDDYDCHWSLRRYYRPELGRRKALQYLDFHTWLPDDILTKVDRVSMAVSLEVRVPFLSRRLCELAFSLPETFIYHDAELKGGLKHAYRDQLDRDTLQRGKRGFSVPADRWKHQMLDGHPGYVRYLLAKMQEQGIEAVV